MKANGITHLSISSRDLDESVGFYTDLFGMEEVPAPEFPFPVRWLRVGDLQIHLFHSDDPAPNGHHFGLDVDDFVAFYSRVKEMGLGDTSGYFQHIYELPEGALQLYIRDPSGNMVEINYPNVADIERSAIDEIRKLGSRPGESPAIYMDR